MTQHQATIIVHVDPTLRRKLKLYAVQQDTTISALVRQLVREYIEQAPEGRLARRQEEAA